MDRGFLYEVKQPCRVLGAQRQKKILSFVSLLVTYVTSSLAFIEKTTHLNREIDRTFNNPYVFIPPASL